MPIPDNTIPRERWSGLSPADQANVRVRTDAGPVHIPAFARAIGADVMAAPISEGAATVADNWHGRMVTFASTCTVTVPAGLRSDFSCGWRQDAAGAISFVAGSGVVLQSLDDLSDSAGQFAVGGLTMYGDDVFGLDGALA